MQPTIIKSELLTHIKNSYPFLKTIKRSGRDFFIGYHHKVDIKNYDCSQELSKKDAIKLFNEDINNIENYSLVKNLKNKIDVELYNVLVHFIFDYGRGVVRNSKFYFYIKENNTEKVIEELEKYKTYRNSVDTLNIKRRSFDIKIIKDSYRVEDKPDDDKKRSTNKNVGFRY